MGYYRGDYYRGDYYQGGLFSSIGNIAKKLAGPALSLIPGGGVVRTALSLTGGGGGRPKRQQLPSPGVGGMISRILPFGETGYYTRRRMNVANPKALRRAIRRAHGFAKLARKVLTFPISKPPRGRPLFKKARRR
jgi:hypothetical protein